MTSQWSPPTRLQDAVRYTLVSGRKYRTFQIENESRENNIFTRIRTWTMYSVPWYCETTASLAGIVNHSLPIHSNAGNKEKRPKSKPAPKIIKTPDMYQRPHVFFCAFRNPSMQSTVQVFGWCIIRHSHLAQTSSLQGLSQSKTGSPRPSGDARERSEK